MIKDMNFFAPYQGQKKEQKNKRNVDKSTFMTLSEIQYISQYGDGGSRTRVQK